MAIRHHGFVAVTTLAAMVLLDPWGTAGPAATLVTDDALSTFNERVELYAALHRRLADPLPWLDPTRDPSSYFVNRRYLALAICSARANAKQGDIFSPEIADLFRIVIAGALVGRHTGAVFDVWPEESWPADDPVVNEPLANNAGDALPAVLLHYLPALPKEMEYRIVNGSLVLVDAYADIVIDVLPDAFHVTSYV